LTVFFCIVAIQKSKAISLLTTKKPNDKRALAGQLRQRLVVVLLTNTNTIGIHPVWDTVPFVSHYELAWGVSVGDYPWSTNVSSNGINLRWSATNPLPIFVVRVSDVIGTSDWSAPFMLTNYANIWTEMSTNLLAWSEIPGTRITIQPTNPMQFYREGIVKSNNYPTFP